MTIFYQRSVLNQSVLVQSQTVHYMYDHFQGYRPLLYFYSRLNNRVIIYLENSCTVVRISAGDTYCSGSTFTDVPTLILIFTGLLITIFFFLQYSFIINAMYNINNMNVIIRMISYRVKYFDTLNNRKKFVLQTLHFCPYE